jgi:hypothetical protein
MPAGLGNSVGLDGIDESGSHQARMDGSDMDTQHRVIAKLLALKDAPDHVIIAQVR